MVVTAIQNLGLKKWREDNGIAFFTMPPEMAEEALDVLRNGFFEEEVVCNFVGISTDKAGQKELEDMVVGCAQDKISIMAVDLANDKIVGVCYNKYQVAPKPGEKNYFEIFKDTKCKTKTAKALMQEMLNYDSLVDMFGIYKADCSAELTFLGTHKDYQQRGIGYGCFLSSLELFRSTLPSPECPKRPPIATAILTSPWSIRIGQKLEFDEVAHLSFKDYIYEGKPLIEHPKVPKDQSGFVIVVKRL